MLAHLCETTVQTPDQIFPTKRNMKKIFLRQLTLSRFLAKTRRLKIKFPWKSFSKKAVVQGRHRWCKKLGCKSDWRMVVITKYVWIYVAVIKWLLYWLIRHKARVRMPGQPSERNMKNKYFFGDFLSVDLWQKLWEKSKPPMKKFLKKKSVVRRWLQLTVGPVTHI